ncbi:acetate--CoA ligase [Thermomicrobium sp. CFH 73360]|uniref:acetate--CoA ligase n=1 Tax=Thermomicrobium sp. CFH 73360 TaxID=2951987 RepID=UPI002076E399|nr:acetate--CoA ligase [Thermomicrobium sp. CFH 73360]MCM8746622.1 acetate--CoA ligase [Thermomicrobium sp. CFH 73360]
MPDEVGMRAAGAIEGLLVETRRFPPPAEFVAQANMRDPSVYERARRDPEGFWASIARELQWDEPWHTVMEWNPPWVKWFVGGRLNASVNCVDRHVAAGRRTKAAIIWEGEPGDERVLTYQDLYREVNRVALALRQLGIEKGDRVAIYLPMIPELPVVMLACARIGAPHSVVFGGFSAEALADRINDCQAKLLITADGGYRRGRVVPLKETADRALERCPSIEKVLVVRRIGESQPVSMQPGRDLWWHEVLAGVRERYCPPESVDSEHPLYILYTSGTTGKPKGQLHTTGGYLTGVYITTKWIFDIKDDDIYWCTADIGWVTGHSYIVYGPLANGATVVMYEGSPDWPEKDRFWDIVERRHVTILYTSPTAIRQFMRWGPEYPARHDLSSLRLLGTVGEPINPEAWMWYHEHIGGGRCPIVDTWWQTETGMILITPLPGLTTTKPGSATLPFPGIEPDILDDAGNPVPTGQGGYLVIRRPWPAISRTLWGDPERYVNTYFSKYGPSIYVTGDGAKRDEDGYYWILGRVDDVLNVAGHRLGTMELESALVAHPAVAEAAVIGVSHEIKGQVPVAFVSVRAGYTPSDELAAELRRHVAETIGAIARPERVIFVADLPKTRSAKIMRRLLRDIAEGRVLGDTTTLTDPTVVEEIKRTWIAEHGEQA